MNPQEKSCIWNRSATVPESLASVFIIYKKANKLLGFNLILTFLCMTGSWGKRLKFEHMHFVYEQQALQPTFVLYEFYINAMQITATVSTIKNKQNKIMQQRKISVLSRFFVLRNLNCIIIF